MKLLVVEDAADVRLVLVATLKRFGYQVRQAADGAEGLAILQQEADIQLVVSDWAMPVMDGFELCRQLKQSRVIDRFIYFIMFSSNDDEERIISGLEMGADDFIAKQAPRAELNARIRAGERIVELHNQLQRKQDKLEKAYASIENDVMQAAEMHSRLLPTVNRLAGVSFASFAVSSAFLGGDMFDYLQLDECHIAFYLLDVSGHGLPAALLSFTLKHVLSPSQQGRSLMKPPHDSAPFYYVADPAEVVAKLNDRFQSDDAHYFTMTSGVLNTQSGLLTLCQAGHPGPLHQTGGEVIEHHRNGFPVGMLPDLDYESYQVQLVPGDRLFLYSDGASECFNLARQEFGVARLRQCLEEGKTLDLESQLQRLKQHLLSWHQGPDFDDDVSILAMEWFRPEGA